MLNFPHTRGIMRRRFKSKTGFPLTKTTGDIARNRGFQMPIEKRKAKRVRFDDAETDASSRGHEATQSPRSGAPKTSEYAYFRKVKDGPCRAVHKQNEQFKSSEHSYRHRESNKEYEKLDRGTKFSISGESAVPSGHKVFISPPVSRYGESNETGRKELTHKTKDMLPLLTETVTPIGQNQFSSPLYPATDKSENQCIEKGIFSEKRKRLCQWVADTSTTSSEVKKLHEKGFDLVSFLLGRLIPKGNENNDSSKENADNSSKPLTVYESDNVGKEPSLCHKRDLHKELPKFSTSERSSAIAVRGWDSYNSEFPSNYPQEGDLQKATDDSERSSELVVWGWDSYDSGFPTKYHKKGDLQKTMAESSNEIVLKEWDSFHSGFPSNHNKDSHLQDETIVPHHHINSRTYNSSDTSHGLSFCFPYDSFKSSDAFHFRDLDEYGPTVGHCREESYRNSLEWDFGTGKVADHHPKQIVYHKPDNAWNSNKHRIEDNNMLDAEGYYPSSLFSRPSLFKPLPEYVPTGCLMHGFRPEFDDVKYAVLEPRQVSVSFPCSPNCMSLPEDKNAEDFLSNGNIILSYRDPRWQKCTSHSDIWWNCLPAPEDHPSTYHAWKFPENGNGSRSLSLLKEAPKESFTPYYDEGPLNNYLLSSTHHPPFDTVMSCPLLLNHVRQDVFDQELYCGAYDSELGYRNML